MHLHGARRYQFLAGYDKPIPDPLQFSELDAYSRVMDSPLRAWEIALIRRLDGLFRSGEFHPLELEPPGGIKAMMMNMKARGKIKNE